jgi:hypothetical protein
MSQISKIPPAKAAKAEKTREICINFQTKGCTKKKCKFLHVPKVETVVEPVAPREFRPIILSSSLPVIEEKKEDIESNLRLYEDRLFNALKTREALSRDSAIAVDKFIGANNPGKMLSEAGYNCISVMEKNSMRFGFFTFGSERRVFAKIPKVEKAAAASVAKAVKTSEMTESIGISDPPLMVDLPEPNLRIERKVERIIMALTELKIKNMDYESVARRFAKHEREPFEQVMKRIHDWMATQNLVFEDSELESIPPEIPESPSLPIPSGAGKMGTGNPDEIERKMSLLAQESILELLKPIENKIVALPAPAPVVATIPYDWEAHNLRILNILCAPFKPMSIPNDIFHKANEKFRMSLETHLTESRLAFSQGFLGKVIEIEQKKTQNEFNHWFNPSVSIQPSTTRDFSGLVAGMDDSTRRALAAALATAERK